MQEALICGCAGCGALAALTKLYFLMLIFIAVLGIVICLDVYHIWCRCRERSVRIKKLRGDIHDASNP